MPALWPLPCDLCRQDAHLLRDEQYSRFACGCQARESARTGREKLNRKELRRIVRRLFLRHAVFPRKSRDVRVLSLLLNVDHAERLA